MTIYYAMYEATPGPDIPEFETCGGAFVNCWVRAESTRDAERLNAAAIAENGWKILSVEDECCEVTDDWYSEDDDEWPWYQQAISEGECYVYHQWPLVAQDEDDVH
jgi:hypothetical protein